MQTLYAVQIAKALAQKRWLDKRQEEGPPSAKGSLSLYFAIVGLWQFLNER